MVQLETFRDRAGQTLIRRSMRSLHAPPASRRAAHPHLAVPFQIEARRPDPAAAVGLRQRLVPEARRQTRITEVRGAHSDSAAIRSKSAGVAGRQGPCTKTALA